jgi:GAF domain-containing protein
LIVEGATQAMDGKAACLYLDRNSGFYEPVAQKGLSEKYLHANPVKAQRLIKALDADGYLAFPDATTDPRLENHDVKKAEGIASILTVPVRHKRRTTGVLALYTAAPREFSPQEVEFLRALAEQGAIVIERSRLVERMRKNAVLFLDLASAINSSLDIRKILQTLTVNVCENFGMKGAVIRLLEEETRTMKMVASHGLSEAFLSLGGQLDPLTARRVFKGETFFVADGTSDDRITYKDAMKKEGVVSMVATPILARDNIIGVMRLYSAKKREFPPDVMATIEAIGHQGGLAIQNGSMYLQLQESKKDLEQEIWSHRSWF